jgi:hypothetical protein
MFWMHRPLFWQVVAAHRLMAISQLTPVNPVVQVHV